MKMVKMLRLGNQLISIRRLLQRHQFAESQFQIAPISRCQFASYKVQVREPCPQIPPPPPPKPTDDSAFWGAMAVLFLAGGFAVYAKRSPEVRDWLTIHAPWFDDIIAIAYEENLTYGEFARKCVEDARNYYKSLMKDEKDVKPKQCSMDGDKPLITAPTRSEVEEKKGESVDPEECEEDPPPAIVTKNVCEVIEMLKDRGDTALANYYTATTACSLYNKAVAETMDNFSIPALKGLHGQKAERLSLVRESVQNAEGAKSDIDELAHYFECGVQGSKQDVESTRLMLNDYRDKINASRIQYEWENDKSTVLDVQWQTVEQLMDKYTDENQTMFPEIKYVQNKLQLFGDPDLLLYHTSRYSQQLKAELNDAVVGMMERVNRAFETLPQGDKEKKQREYMMQSVLKQKRAEMDAEYRKRYDDQRKSNEQILKDSLKKQLERHQETLEHRLKQKEAEATVKLNKLVAEKVEFEKRMFAKQLNEMAIKLKLVEDKLNAKLKAERETRRSQELWVAGASLLRATKKGDSYVNVQKELNAIEKASGDGDKLVTTVLKAIPESVREKGVVPESVLRDRYHQMEKVALNVALVERDGAPLPVYFLSWLQSTLLFMKLSGIPQVEIDTPPKEPFKDLDTFDLLQRARFWIERGNLAAAIRYVSSLEGASRAAAMSWHDAARSHLETRQAAEAVLAHAAAMGLQYI